MPSLLLHALLLLEIFPFIYKRKNNISFLNNFTSKSQVSYLWTSISSLLRCSPFCSSSCLLQEQYSCFLDSFSQILLQPTVATRRSSSNLSVSQMLQRAWRKRLFLPQWVLFPSSLGFGLGCLHCGSHLVSTR